MGAIDLLLSIKPDAEPLHQVAVAALLRHSPLLRRLGVLPGDTAPGAETWEPLGGSYDLALTLGGGSQLFVALKVDEDLSADLLRRQLQELRAEGRAADRVLYLLLGYSAVTSARRLLALAREVGVADRVFCRTAADLAAPLGSPALLFDPGDAAPLDPGSARDARDLAVAYRDHLLRLAARVMGFGTRPLATWGEGDYYGFFALLRERVPLCADAEIAANPGGFITCSFDDHIATPGVRLALHYDGPRLCLKIEVESAERRSALRDLAVAHLLRLSPPAPLQIIRPARLGHGRVMTLAYLEGLPFGLPERLADQERGLVAASAVVHSTAARLATA